MPLRFGLSYFLMSGMPSFVIELRPNKLHIVEWKYSFRHDSTTGFVGPLTPGNAMLR